MPYINGTVVQWIKDVPHVKAKEAKMTNPTLEEQLIDTLKSAIAAKDDLIDHLKKEVQRLQSSQTIINTPSPPNTPQPAYLPGHQDTPYSPPQRTTISQDDLNKNIITALPPGSIQSGPCTFHDMIKWGDQTSGGESCMNCGFGSGWLTSINTDFSGRTTLISNTS